MKPILYWKVGNTLTTDYDSAIIMLNERDLNTNGIEND